MAIERVYGFDDGLLDFIITVSGGIAGGLTINSSVPRTGTGCLAIGAGNVKTYRINMPKNNVSGIVNFGLRLSTLTENIDTLELQDNGTTHLRLTFRSDGKISMYRGPGTTLLGVGTYVITPNTWFHIRWKYIIDDATGLSEIRINGSPTADITFSGDTRNGVNAYVNQWMMFSNGAAHGDTANAMLIDDLIFQDLLGSAPENDWLDETQARPIFVTADDASTGYVVGGTSPAATLWQSVSEAVSDELVKTIDSGAVNDYASFVVQDIPSTVSAVYALVVLMRAMKSAAGLREITGRVDVGGTVAVGSVNHTLSTNLLTYQSIFHRDPSAAAWTVANVNAAKLGVKTVT